MKTVHWQPDLEQIKYTRLFNNVALGSLHKLLETACALQLHNGEILLSPFNRNEYLYLVISGQLKVYLGSPDSAPVSVLNVGDCAGEISFIDNERPSAYVLAGEPSRVLRLHRQALIDLFSQSPQLMQNMLQLLCERVRQGNKVLQNAEQNANVDTLTGLFNRRWLEHIWERESTRCAFNDKPLCMLMLDVDYFKAYNDRHGHLAGDYALCLVAHTLRQQLRPKDSMVRFGGEEFIILLPDLAQEEARAIAERLRSSLERIEHFYAPIGELPGVTVSIGLAQMQPRDSLQALIARADAALYEAKQHGRNCLCG